MTDATGGADPDAPVAWRVVRGGDLSPEEVAAITVALTPVPAVDDDHAADRPHHGPSNWQRAALVVGVGGRPPTSVQDLVGGRFGLGHVGNPTAPVTHR